MKRTSREKQGARGVRQGARSGPKAKRRGALRASLRGMGFERGRRALSPRADLVTDTAKEGVRGAGGDMPHLDRIQAAFGKHAVGHVRAHVGGEGGAAARRIGARGFALGNDVAFDGAPSLHTAAHEAAHTLQQQRGVQLAGGVGQSGDAYEQAADAVADRVVAGKSAEDLLTSMVGSRGGSTTTAVQKDETDPDWWKSSQWYADQQDQRFEWCLNGEGEHGEALEGDIPACEQQVEKWTNQPYSKTELPEDTVTPTPNWCVPDGVTLPAGVEADCTQPVYSSTPAAPESSREWWDEELRNSYESCNAPYVAKDLVCGVARPQAGLHPECTENPEQRQAAVDKCVTSQVHSDLTEQKGVVGSGDHQNVSKKYEEWKEKEGL